jgi:large subunit ribosomal protein L13
MVEIVIDASDSILGRAASFAAKQALLGKKVIIVNCDNIKLTGRRRMIIDEYNQARRRGGTSLNGPHFPKHCDRIMKRTIRGMLSYNQQRGLTALKNVMCYNNVPKEYESAKKITIIKELKVKTIRLSDLSKEI